ncbi:MAG: hypothetical protein WCO94_14305 [Verrucomicrobiota bacterium]
MVLFAPGSDCPPLQPSILGAIRRTPLIELRRIVAQRGLRGRLLAKLEYL